MKTFQELERAGTSFEARMEFIKAAIREHKTSEAYRTAYAAELYYAKRNVTIEKFQKFLYNIAGQKVPDLFGADYKLKTLFFRRFVTQQVQYVLSNGVTFEGENTKEKLGKDFDSKLTALAKKAMVGGVAFGFFNLDHLDVFGLADTDKEPGFVPIQDEETGLLRAGIRYWAIGDTERMTLYEEDGYTDYIHKKGEDPKELQAKKAYKQKRSITQRGGVESEVGENYPGFPIIPMYANDLKTSELVGIRESIDCYDFIKSGLANAIDDTNGFYWILKNAGGMDDVDIQQFVERLKAVRGTALMDGVEAEAHTIEVPTEARSKMLEILRTDLYEDFQIVNVKELSSGAKTATEIRAAYQPMDDKCGDFEYCVRDFISRLFELVGIEDEPSFKWNRIANQTEETNMVLAAAPYLDDESVLKHLPWLTPEEVDEILERKDAEAMERMTPSALEGPGAEPVEE